MKLNGTPRHYMPLSQSQSDDEENVPKQLKFQKSSESIDVHKSFDSQLYMTKNSCEDPKYLPMSPLRTVAFIVSLLLCVLFIVVILWFLPCESRDHLEKWSTVLDNKSVTSGIALARTSLFSSPLLVFGYSQLETESRKQYGVIAMQKSDGTKLWQLNLHFEATSILCNTIDVNRDGCSDCLVIGSQGMMTAVDAKTGNNLWYLHSHSATRVADSVSMPTLLPDCNGDLVPELAVSYTFSTETTSAYMGLISGGTGEVIGSPVPIHHCISPVIAHSSLTWKNTTTFVFYCTDGKAANLFFARVQDFCDMALNRTDRMKSLNALYRAIPYYPEVQFHQVSEEELVIILNIQKIILVTATSNKLKVKWVKRMKDGFPWRAVAHGQFLKGGSSQLVLISTSDSGSKVIGLSLSNGSKVWSAPFYNSTVTLAFSLPTFFTDVDGIVLKMLTTKSSVKPKHNVRDTTVGYNMSVTNSDVKEFLQQHDGLQSAEEKYVLLHSGKFPQFTNISMHEIWYICKDFVCQPDVFTRRDTAVAAQLNNEEVDMSVISTSLVPSNIIGPLHFQTTVKLLKIENFSQFSKCIYKLNP